MKKLRDLTNGEGGYILLDRNPYQDEASSKTLAEVIRDGDIIYVIAIYDPQTEVWIVEGNMELIADPDVEVVESLVEASEKFKFKIIN